MVPDEAFERAAHVELEHAAVGLHQIDDDQAVDDVRKLVVQVETEELAAEFEVLTKQLGEALAIDLGVGDDSGEIGGGREHGARVAEAAGTEGTGPDGVFGPDAAM